MKQNIDNWLEQFKTGWINKDIESLMCLFSDKVEYWENPFLKLTGKEKIREVWQEIEGQENINLDLDLYCSDNNKHAVQWTLGFETKDQHNDYRGTYLIELDEADKCCFFYQCSYQKKI